MGKVERLVVVVGEMVVGYRGVSIIGIVASTGVSRRGYDGLGGRR